MKMLELRFAALIGAALALSLPAGAVYTNVTPSNETPGLCDTLVSFVGAGVDELGTAPAFPADELISSASASTLVTACPSAALPTGSNVLVSITNLTPFTFTDLWYAADPETSFTNWDGYINGVLSLGFKIDNTGPLDLNRPLQLDAASSDGLFQPGDTWSFVIDGYSNSLGLPASALGSIGVPSVGPGPCCVTSSGSIIAIPFQYTPEPTTGTLFGLGLLGMALTRRRPR